MFLSQRSFPLTEEEYILRLDDVANTLKCWGAVSHIRNCLAMSKERPRIGKVMFLLKKIHKKMLRNIQSFQQRLGCTIGEIIYNSDDLPNEIHGPAKKLVDRTHILFIF